MRRRLLLPALLVASTVANLWLAIGLHRSGLSVDDLVEQVATERGALAEASRIAGWCLYDAHVAITRIDSMNHAFLGLREGVQ